MEQLSTKFIESFVTTCMDEGLTKEATAALLEKSALEHLSESRPGYAAGFAEVSGKGVVTLDGNDIDREWMQKNARLGWLKPVATNAWQGIRKSLGGGKDFVKAFTTPASGKIKQTTRGEWGSLGKKVAPYALGGGAILGGHQFVTRDSRNARSTSPEFYGNKDSADQLLYDTNDNSTRSFAREEEMREKIENGDADGRTLEAYDSLVESRKNNEGSKERAYKRLESARDKSQAAAERSRKDMDTFRNRGNIMGAWDWLSTFGDSSEDRARMAANAHAQHTKDYKESRRRLGILDRNLISGPRNKKGISHHDRYFGPYQSKY